MLYLVFLIFFPLHMIGKNGFQPPIPTPHRFSGPGVGSVAAVTPEKRPKKGPYAKIGLFFVYIIVGGSRATTMGKFTF